MCDQGCEWHDKDLCILCLGGHPCTPVPADGASEAQGGEAGDGGATGQSGTSEHRHAVAAGLLHLLCFAACFGMGCAATLHPALAAVLAYAVTWAVTRLRPQTHYQHCRTWTLLAVGSVTLPRCFWVTVLSCAWLSLCPKWMLW